VKALTWSSVGSAQLVERPKPTLQLPTDAIVGVTHVSACGTDIYVRDGVHPTSEIGRILGHEGIGERHRPGQCKYNQFFIHNRPSWSLLRGAGRANRDPALGNMRFLVGDGPARHFLKDTFPSQLDKVLHDKSLFLFVQLSATSRIR
jgi:hypothetical protein